MKKIALHWQILIGMIIGGILGFSFNVNRDCLYLRKPGRIPAISRLLVGWPRLGSGPPEGMSLHLFHQVAHQELSGRTISRLKREPLVGREGSEQDKACYHEDEDREDDLDQGHPGYERVFNCLRFAQNRHLGI